MGANINPRGYPPLDGAVTIQNIALVRHFIEQGADFNRSDIQSTATMSAMNWADIDILRLLLAAGAWPNVASKTAGIVIMTPLQRAAEIGQIEVARLLIDYGEI